MNDGSPELPKSLAWQAYEHAFYERSSEWYWVVGIIAIATAIAAVILGNMLFGILIILSAFTLALFATKRPDIVSFELDERGIRIDRTLYPYRTLKTFYVTHESPYDGARRLLIESSKPLMPLMIIPFSEGVSPDTVRDFLLQYLKEEEHREPVAHHLLEMFGF